MGIECCIYKTSKKRHLDGEETRIPSNIRRGSCPKTYGAEAFVKIARQKRNPESSRFFWKNKPLLKKEEDNQFPQFRGWTPNKRFCFSKSAPLIGRYGTIFAPKWSSNGRLQAVASK